MILADYTEINYANMFTDLLDKGKFPESISDDIDLFKRVRKETNIYYDEQESYRDKNIVNITYGYEWGKSPSDPDGSFIAFYITFDYRKEIILSCAFDHG